MVCIIFMQGNAQDSVLPFQMKNLLKVNQITLFHLDFKLLPSTPATKQGEKGMGSISKGESGS